MRYVLEGEWTGYISAQRHIVHREVVTSEKRAVALRNLRSIVYTDGTSLLLHLREAKPREHVEPLNRYGWLINDALQHGGGKSRVLVADLLKEEQP